MRLGVYLFSAVIFSILVAAATYMINPGSYSFEIFGIHMPPLPVAVWVVIPLILLVFFTILHMMYHGTRNFFAQRKWRKDADELEDAFYWSVLQEPKEHHFSIPAINKSANLLSVSRLNVNKIVHPLSDRLAKTLEWVKEIENGVYVDLKAKKIEKLLSMENPLLIKNQINRLEKDKDFLQNVIEYHDKYAPSVNEKALDILVEKETFFKVKQYAKRVGKERFMRMLDRAESDKEIGLNPGMMEYFMSVYELDCRDYINLAKTALKKFTPDETLNIFKEFSKKDNKAEGAYIYLLFEYELLDKAGQLLEEHNEDEFKVFRALYILKREKHNFRVNEIITTDNVCNEA